MHISEFFNIFDLSYPGLEKVSYFISCLDYNSAKKELLKYFILRKQAHLATSEEITEKDKNFPLAYISRHCILSGPNEADLYLSSMFLSKTDDYTTMDILPFIKKNLSFMIMSRQKEKECAFFYSPNSIFPPYVLLVDKNGNETRIPPSKYAYISTSSPDHPLWEEDIYEICEESSSPEEPFGSNTGRVYLAFDFSDIDLNSVISARFSAKITLPRAITKKELLFFNVADSSWDESLTWSRVLGNVYSWESSQSGPSWVSPRGSDSEYLNVICRFWFARPMAYQYLSDVEKNAVYGEKLLFLMDAFSKKKEGGFNRVLETGERLSNFTAVLNALIDTPVMTPDYLVSILWMMYRDMKSLSENPDLGWSNWAVVRTCGLSKAIDFLPEFKEHEEWKSAVRPLLDELFDRMYSPDFSFKESGFSYSFWCTELFSGAYNSSVLNNDPCSAFMRSRLEKAFDASLDLLYPNFYDTNIGDSNYTSKIDYLKNIGKLFPTKKLICYTNGKDDPSVPLSAFYPYAGSVVMRNTFSKENSIYLAMHSTPFDGHAHNDIGSIVLYGYNRPLITDCGRYGYSQSEISAYLKSAGAHNSVEIENGNYLPHSKSDAKITFFASNNVFDAAVSCAKPYEGAFHKRSVLFVKSEGFVIVSDYVTSSHGANKFNQNWHFMPEANISGDYNNHLKTNFFKGSNIKLICPDADVLETNSDIFSPGYGMAEKSTKAAFVKYGQNISMTTLLLPYKNEEIKATGESVSTPDLSVSSAVFEIESSRGVFGAKNTSSEKFSEFISDADIIFSYKGAFFLVNASHLASSSKVIIESHKKIPDMYIKISGGIVEIESSSLVPSTKREECVRIYSPKTTHVIFNGKSIPFTLYSDYVYAVTTK